MFYLRCYFLFQNNLFQTILILTTVVPFKQWQKVISEFVRQAKNQVLNMNCCKMLKKEPLGLGLPGLKLYFAAFCQGQIKEWVILRNRKLLELGRQDLRFGWHAYLDGITKLRLI